MIVGGIYVVGLQSWRTHGRVRTGVNWVPPVSSWSGVPITVRPVQPLNARCPL